MVAPHANNLLAAIHGVTEAHDAIGQAIMTHAERHAARLTELRSKLESDHAIKSGIERAIAPK